MVYVLLAPGFEEAEALVTADMLRRAGIETALVSIGDQAVMGSHGISVAADETLDRVGLSNAEMLVLPGGGTGVKNLGGEPKVEQLVREALERGLWVAAICAAPTLLGRWGLLKGKEAVCYPGMEDQLAGAQVRMERKVVQDGRIITGRAAGSAFEFGLSLVEALAGKEAADKVCTAIHF